MKIIYRGGYQTANSDQSLFYEYSTQIKRFINNGKNVVYVTFAKPNNYYDTRMVESLGFIPQVVDTNCGKGVDWGSFDLIVIPGGETEVLQQCLIDWGFSLSKLKQEVIVIGDSAGAYVLSKFYFGKKQNINGQTEYYLIEGLNPKSNLLTIAHIDNQKHATPEKLVEAQKVASDVQATLLLLKENEAKMVENNGIVRNFSIEEVLNC